MDKRVYEFISQQTQDPINERKNCQKCSAPFAIFESDLKFYNKIAPVFAEQKYGIPPPKLCPQCREQRRMIFRNERKLYRRKCDFSGKEIISIYSPEKPFKVYDQKIRR